MKFIKLIIRWLDKQYRIRYEQYIVHKYKLQSIFSYFFNIVKPERNDFSDIQINDFINNYYPEYEPDHTLDAVSDIWREIVRNNSIKALKLIQSKDSKTLKYLYDNYHDSDLALGADDSSLLKNPYFKLRAAIRHQEQIYSFMIHRDLMPLPNKFQPNSGIKHTLLMAESELINIIEDISASVRFSQFYQFKFSKATLPIDFLDHLYFYDIIDKFINSEEGNFIEIGGGTGTLSMLLSELGNHKVNMIDLAPFLLNQNLLLGNKHNYIPSEYVQKTTPMNIKYAVNQDSFPEISKPELVKLIKFMSDCNVEYIFSYNQTSNYRNQTDYSVLLNESGYRELISYVSPMRQGYKVKIFKRTKL